jgi:hypothetical protein
VRRPIHDRIAIHAGLDATGPKIGQQVILTVIASFFAIFFLLGKVIVESFLALLPLLARKVDKIEARRPLTPDI